MYKDINKIILTGTAPTPLASYLKALGIFRLLAEQKDSSILGSWNDNGFVLLTKIHRDEITAFFLKEYQPTPIIAPWNSGSGFFPGDNKSGIDPLTQANAARFFSIKNSIIQAKNILRQLDITKEPSKDSEKKALLLTTLRSSGDDSFVVWLDAAVLVANNKLMFPPLLGTGGNDGRLDFTNNFMQRIVELFDLDTGNPQLLTPTWLEQSLYGTPTPNMTKNPIGQFAPGQAGGANSTTGFEADAQINPFDFVLMLEGTLVFAAAATRRMQSSDQNNLAYPFTVRSAAVGNGGIAQSDTETSHGEIWLPLWHNAVSFKEIRTLFAEGRATVGRRNAIDGLDFARAIGQLGVDRGISAFERYAFLKRNGKAFFSTSLGRLESLRQSNVDLIANLDNYDFLARIKKLYKSDISQSIIQSINNLQEAIFHMTLPGSSRDNVQRTLIHLGKLIFALSRSHKAQENIAYLPRLSNEWLKSADDGSSEFHIAAALASLPNLKNYLLPVKQEGSMWVWSTSKSHYQMNYINLLSIIPNFIERQLIEASTSEKYIDIFYTYNEKNRASLADIHAFINKATDDEHIANLLYGLIWVDMSQPWEKTSPRQTNRPTWPLPASFTVLKPFFTSNILLEKIKRIPEDTKLPLPIVLCRLLQAGQVQTAVTKAWHLGHIAGMSWPTGPSPRAHQQNSTRLLTALAIPLQIEALKDIIPPLVTANNQDNSNNNTHELTAY